MQFIPKNSESSFKPLLYSLFSKLINEHKCFEEYEGVNGVFYCENTIEINDFLEISIQ